MKESDKFLKMYDEYFTLINNNEFDKVKELMKKSLSDPEVSPGELKTILIITKGFKKHEIIGETRKIVLDTLENMLGHKIV